MLALVPGDRFPVQADGIRVLQTLERSSQVCVRLGLISSSDRENGFPIDARVPREHFFAPERPVAHLALVRLGRRLHGQVKEICVVGVGTCIPWTRSHVFVGRSSGESWGGCSNV